MTYTHILVKEDDFLYTLISKLVYTKPSFIADDVDHIATNPLSIEFDKKCLYCIFLV